MESKILRNKMHIIANSKPVPVLRNITKRIGREYVTDEFFYNPIEQNYNLTVEGRPNLLKAFDEDDTIAVSRYYNTMIKTKQITDEF